jgi:secretion-regulating guanine nucleotide exchange factor
MDNNNEDVIHFACGQNHISFVKRDGTEIHSIGENKFGQCTRIVLDEKILRIESGWTHVAYLTESRKLFLYGRNNYGQLGNGSRNEIDSDTPHQCLIFPVDDFALGAEHGILKSNGAVYTWGWNEHRNCGVDSDDDM